MKRINNHLPIILILVVASLLLIDSTSAQRRSSESKKSKRTYYSNYEKSASTKGSAADIQIKTNRKSNNELSEYYPPNKKTEKDSYTRKKNNYRNKENDFSENYFRIDKSKNSLWDGKHWKESRFPLNIYVKESSSRYYKSAYKDYVKYAMDVWRKADDRIQYKFVKSVDDADIAVLFVENLGDKYEENYLGLTDYDTDKNKQIEFSKIQISLIKNGDEKISAGEIKATIIHELGHAFGLGHSDSDKDLMYPYISPEHTPELSYDELSIGDKFAIKDLISLSFEEYFVWK